MNIIDTKMADALAREGRGFGPGGAGAPPAPAKPQPRTIREGDWPGKTTAKPKAAKKKGA